MIDLTAEDMTVQLRILRPKKGDVVICHFDFYPTEFDLDQMREVFQGLKLDDPTLRIPIIFEYPGQEIKIEERE